LHDALPISPTMGRTHGVHAEPTTFGLKLAGWAFELERSRVRLERALEGLRVGKLSGAVGTYSATDPELERIACERLGVEPAPVSTQILQRDRHAELLSVLALVAGADRAPRRVPRARLHARPVRVARRGPRRPGRADAREPAVEPRPLLQPARAACARRVGSGPRRGVPPRPAPRDARLGRGAR